MAVATRRYRRFLSNNLQTTFVDDEVVAVGINTARALTIKKGRIKKQQSERMWKRFNRASDAAVRFVAPRHSFDPPGSFSGQAKSGSPSKMGRKQRRELIP